MTSKPDKRAQRQKFIDKAKELGVDESEEAFDDKLKRIAKAPKSKTKKDSAGPNDC